MAIIVIGGHSRSVGKTSVVAGLIAAMPAHNWTAFKITQYGHGICSRSSRFLVAGATRAWWVRTEQGRLAEAMPTILRRLRESENAILESNSLLKFLRPDLYITVLDPATADFKKSAQEFLDRADAVIVHEAAQIVWQGISLKPVAGRLVFYIHPPEYVTPEITQFVKSKLSYFPPMGIGNFENFG